MKKVYSIILSLLIIILSNNFIFAQYKIKKYVLGVGSNDIGNITYKVTNTIGQPFIGKTSNSAKINYSGYWNPKKESSFTYPSTITIDYNQSFGNGDVSNTNNYRIAGLPGDSSIPVNMSGEYEYDWQVYWDNGAENNYLVNSSSYSFSPGKAYWILSKNSLNINQSNVPSVPLSESSNYCSIDLHNGWNLISTPFERNTQWSNVRVLNGLDNNDILYSWNGSLPYSNPAVLTPYEGYYFNNDSGLDSLKIPYEPNGSLGKLISENEYPINIKNFLQLKMKEKNQIEASEVFIGLNKNSEDGFDENDFYAAPGDFQKIGINLVRNELPRRDKYFFIEQRPDIGEGQEFDVEIKAVPNNFVEIGIDGIENFNEYNIYLLEDRLKNIYNLKEKEKIELKLAHQYNSFKLYIGTDEYINKIKEKILPLRYQLYQNYPNPFNPNTIIRFSLREAENVTIKIFNILGEEVTTLLHSESYEAGNYEVEFSGKEFSSGVYVVRMDAGKFSAQKKIVLIK